MIRVYAIFISISLLLGSAPSSRPSDELRTQFAQLADPDPDVRDSAREALMGLRLPQLDELKKIAADARPLAPAQASALHDIVVHVYLASQPYDRETPSSGFMGVSLGPSARLGVPAAGGDGAIVYQRYPGFVAYRLLRDGDAIVGLPDRGITIHSATDLMNALRSMPARTKVQLEVQRGGRTIIIPLTLDPRPKMATISEMDREAMLEPAEDYWEENFAPIVEPDAAAPTTRDSSSSSAAGREP